MSMNGSVPEQAPPTADEYADYLGAFYLALQHRGFDRKQAFEMVTIAMRAAASAEAGTP